MQPSDRQSENMGAATFLSSCSAICVCGVQVSGDECVDADGRSALAAQGCGFEFATRRPFLTADHGGHDEPLGDDLRLTVGL
eukprot:CAMPEP_0181255000 /NCGR_PEP_ID=MMETSP1096-20121128/48911_1 /TAXON_ID=156174 ORGANISM="Chrysochromulina ericina, Strain CCMP281" /NCGR_SAMPLE_ID=MMETSP1096 /ASSEMBLY_ACC=CAM_ASM_000453 /LENGTH=81 /DNA_ID=CAMNT_0023353089 /DNA_START=253 /DNA_END=499 /DNA_ORIENTATION=-